MQGTLDLQLHSKLHAAQQGLVYANMDTCLNHLPQEHNTWAGTTTNTKKVTALFNRNVAPLIKLYNAFNSVIHRSAVNEKLKK